MIRDASGAADPRTEATIATVTRCNDALNRHDLDAVMALMTEDCLVESTYPPHTFNGGQHVRGVDVLRVRDGQVAEKLAYVKG